LVNYDYFLHFKIDGQPFKVRWVRDFTASVRNGALIYEFTVPCHVRAVSQPKRISVAPYDPSFYSHVLFAETDPVTIENGGKYNISYKVEKNPQEAYYNGLAQPYEMILYFGLKNG
jgi:nickel/cobalt transporter (NicO) family protein